MEKPMTQQTISESEEQSEKRQEDVILSVDSLTKKFGGLTAVDNLSFDVFRNEILGFIGPNGAGKSTTFDCIFGSYSPTSGTVRFKGEDVTDLQPYEMRNKGVARTFQTFRPLPDRNVLANVRLPLTPDRLLTVSGLFGRTEEKAVEICRRVGLEDDLHKMPEELPHAGMIRLEIARAIASPPELLLIDEPFAGLSDAEIDEISELFVELRDDGITFIIVDHNMHGLLTLIDRAIVINFGELIADAPPDEVTESKEVQEAYLGGDAV
jgi:branched-chain amino acid transport system ATP-binding protein